MRQGLIDHSDSLGAQARFGRGDVQWLTAGRGVVHSEMFPLLRQDAPNPAELFQIWLNLPARNKMVAPYFTMFWSDTVPRVTETDAEGRTTEVTVVAGRLASAPQAEPHPVDDDVGGPAGVAVAGVGQPRAPHQHLGRRAPRKR